MWIHKHENGCMKHELMKQEKCDNVICNGKMCTLSGCDLDLHM